MRRAGAWLVVALAVALPLSTAAQEIALGLGLVLALATPRRGALGSEPWARPAVATALVWVLGSFASGNLHEGAGHAWLLAPLVVVPALAGEESMRKRAVDLGLAAACVASAWAIAQRVGGTPGHAGLSHHLSLAYALLPPLGVAIAGRRYGIATTLAAGVLATGSEGAAVALAVTAGAALSRRPLPALAVGVVTTLALLGAADPDELRQRAILWTGGLTVAAGGPVGPGAYAAASAPAYDALDPGFWFPNHAHDSAVQLLAVLGPAGLLATLWLCLVALRRGAVGPAAGLAGVLVGALTQDVLGDLEVARAAWTWLALFGAATVAPSLASDPGGTSSRGEVQSGHVPRAPPPGAGG